MSEFTSSNKSELTEPNKITDESCSNIITNNEAELTELTELTELNNPNKFTDDDEFTHDIEVIDDIEVIEVNDDDYNDNIELTHDNEETYDNDVTSQLISLLNPDLSLKLLNLLKKTSDATTEQTINLVTREFEQYLNLENEVTDVKTDIVEPVINTSIQNATNLTLENVVQNKNDASVTRTNIDADLSILPNIQNIIQAAVQEAVQAAMQPKTNTQDASTSQPVIRVDDTPPSVVIKEEEPKISEIDDFLENKKIKKKDLEGHTQLEPKLTDILIKLVSNDKIKIVMEIGFNAGHSADTFLKSNENITLISFDIATHPYVDAGKTYIDKKYPGRHTLIKGDSRTTILDYYRQNPEQKFDLIFIDGGHYENIPQSDLANCRLFAHENTVVAMNDVKYKNVESWNIKPNEAWETFVESNSIDEIRHLEFPPNNGLAYGKYNSLEIYTCSLLRDDRMQFIRKNQQLFPLIKTFKSVNGYSTKETLEEISNLKLKYVDLDNSFRTYGTLACWITKYKMLKYQVDNEIPFLCFIEDDLIVENNFYTYVSEALTHFKSNVNILRMMTWGEGYITSYESAKRLLEHLSRDGIIRNIDNQLREHCGYEIALKNAPMKVMIAGNNGDSGKTKNLTEFNIHDWC